MSIEGPSEIAKPFRGFGDRVNTEAEAFAEAFDKYVSDLPTRNKFKAAKELVNEFKEIAEEAVAELKKHNEREVRAQLRREWGDHMQLSMSNSPSHSLGNSLATSTAARKGEQVKELRAMQEEVDTWELLSLILDIHYNPDKEELQRDKEDEVARMGPLHHYVPEHEVWERFLLEDDVAKERSLIKTWLEQTADHQESDLESILEELESKSGSRGGLSSKGWMHTREALKAARRGLGWFGPVLDEAPRIDRTDTSELLVASLDPDATARQLRTLEKPDQYFERAMWITCWEMLRRGMSWEEISAWFEQRNEGWRAVSIGKASSPADVLSNAAWRRMCYIASLSGCSNEYEAAVYGLLGGNAQAVQKIGRSVDDHLYAYYSAVLLRQFDSYLSTHRPDRFSQVLSKHTHIDEVANDPEYAQRQITNLILQLRQRPETKGDAARPLKIIQSYLLANEADSLIHTLGIAIADLDTREGTAGVENMIIRRFQNPEQTVDSPEADIALSPQSLRIAVHLCLILREMRPDPIDSDDLDFEENVVVAYIQRLREAGEIDIVPLYASRLQHARYIITLGKFLSDIRNPKDQGTMLRLLQEVYHLDVVSILEHHIQHIFDPSLRKGDEHERPLHIVEPSKEAFHPGQRITDSFLPDAMDGDDVAVIQGLNWFQILRGHWKPTFKALTLALQQCLVTGRFRCAQEIIAEYPYETVSTRKSYEVIGMSINMMEYSGSMPGDEEEALQWQLMRRQSATYYELEKLILAIESLQHPWRIEEKKYTSTPVKPAKTPPTVKNAFTGVKEAMGPILGGILLNPEDEAQAKTLRLIRTQYIPELLLGYNAALHSAGNLISRDFSLESMDLAVAIADDSTGFAEAFKWAGRLRELMQQFASTSRNMLVLKATGKAWKSKKDRVGKELGIWDIAGTGDGHEDGLGALEAA
ncbi:hypothetical protein K431DRAFT_221794 [Polychaeton citri CBS 116435]|uniref:Nuclear pore complex protein n=1 Tax=Polychaeton citri CBS 116435 TaxID=1314669 RepID=A0A9P4QCY3_9PEZI|nr:hypothetical protein K431DRAFT_221794 [Polychaeton citri CBS 116435]